MLPEDGFVALWLSEDSAEGIVDRCATQVCERKKDSLPQKQQKRNLEPGGSPEAEASSHMGNYFIPC